MIPLPDEVKMATMLVGLGLIGGLGLLLWQAVREVTEESRLRLRRQRTLDRFREDVRSTLSEALARGLGVSHKGKSALSTQNGWSGT